MSGRWARSVRDRFLASDPGWGRAQAARRMLVSLIVAFATSYYVASRLGQPVLLAMAGGGVLGLISSVMVADAPIVQMGARVGWHVIPYAAGVGLGLFLGADRPLGLTVIVLVIFLQFYLDRFGPYGHLFGVMLFASYLIGLTQPPGQIGRAHV